MKTMELAKATSALATYARRVGSEPMVFTQRGRPVAALVRLTNVDMETLALSNDPRFIALIEQSRRRHERQGGISTSEMRRRLGVQQPPRKAAARSKRRMSDVSKTSRSSSN
jgi:hypothetical protein